MNMVILTSKIDDCDIYDVDGIISYLDIPEDVEIYSYLDLEEYVEHCNRKAGFEQFKLMKEDYYNAAIEIFNMVADASELEINKIRKCQEWLDDTYLMDVCTTRSGHRTVWYTDNIYDIAIDVDSMRAMIEEEMEEELR